MADAFVLGCDPAGRLLTMTLSGFWTAEMVARFAPEWRASVRRNWGTSGYRCLCDLSDFPPQSQEVTAAFDALLQEDGLAAKQVAIVTASMLTGMQVKRVSGPDKARVFTNREAALSWLEAQSETT